MGRTLWNEGRVVGYSAYEIYMRNVLLDDPEAEPASEKEWLSSTIAMGSSMLLRIGEDILSGLHYIEVPLPTTSRLCAANTIIASLFLGEGEVNGDPTATGWATKVTDYGPLIRNTSESSPSDDGSTIPPDNHSDITITSEMIEQIKNYMLICDGIVIQPGTWTVSGTTPYKDFTPTLTEVPKLRIALSNKVTTPFYVLLTGFTNKGVIAGTSGFTSAVTTQSNADGDFLGPWEFPWAAKILFNVTPMMMQYMDSATYDRALPASGTSVELDSTSIIDMGSTNPYTYYSDHYETAVQDIYVTDILVPKSDAAILTIYQLDEDLPPALYGTLIGNGETGTDHISPIDVVAPGSNKVWDVFADRSDISASGELVATYEDATVATTAYIRDIGDPNDQETYPATYILYQRDKYTDSMIPVAKVGKTNLFGMLTVRELSYTDGSVIGPILYVEGSYPSSYVHFQDNSGNPLTPGEAHNMDGSLWRATVDQPLRGVLPAAAQTEINTNGYVSGTTILADPLPYDGVSAMIWKRITGRMSAEIQAACGYEYYVGGSLNPIFAPGGVWESATLTLAQQIPAGEEEDYYLLIPGNYVSNNIVWPVRKSDQMIDVTVRFGFNIIANGISINLAGFQNDMDAGMNSGLLGTWWDAAVDPDTGESHLYSSGWAYINAEDDQGDPVSHPVVKGVVPDNSTGQVYFGNAMLPVAGSYDETMVNIFGSTLLDAYGIASKYYNYSLRRFLEVALYTDMGTEELLPANNANIKQPIQICLTTNTTTVETAFTLSLTNSASTTGKTQLMTIPEQYQDKANYPVGTVMETGREKGVALSMVDPTGTPYPLDGTSGDIQVPDTGLNWTHLITALYQDKTLDLLGQILISIRSHITGVSDNYLEFANGGTPIRLYVSNTVPADNDIPDGSVGIGWNGVKVYSGGVWS